MMPDKFVCAVQKLSADWCKFGELKLTRGKSWPLDDLDIFDSLSGVYIATILLRSVERSKYSLAGKDGAWQGLHCRKMVD